MAQNVDTKAVSQIERVVSYVLENAETISQAHEHLGIPMDELICAAVVRACKSTVVDTHQLSLFGLKCETRSVR